MAVLNCIQKMGFSEEEAKVILDEVGSADPAAAVGIVEKYMKALEAERADILKQAGAEQPAPAKGQLEMFPEDPTLPQAYQGLARETMINEVLGGDRMPKVADVMANQSGTITPTKEPNHVNYRYVEGPQDVLAIQARMAEVFQQEIEARRGKEGWGETQQKAAELLRNKSPEELVGQGFDNLAAKAMAHQAMAQRAAFDLAQISAQIREAGKANATPEMLAKQVEAIEMLAMLHAIDQGNGAEIARALNARKAARNVAALGTEASELLAKYGEDPHKLAQMIGELGSAEELANFAQKVTKATVWDKVVEAWKSGLVSGPLTQLFNAYGNITFAATRPLVDLVGAAVGAFRSDANRVRAVEPLARIQGDIMGVLDGAKVAAAVMRTGEQPGKLESHRKAIDGKLGEAVRYPFRMLSAADAFFRVVNERGEAYTLAARQAVSEGHNPMTREYRQRVLDLVTNPTDAMIDQIDAAGQRFTFNTPLGEKGRAVQSLIRKAHLEWAMPFVQTPANVFKEMTRLTPAAPIVGEWRAAFAEGGAARDKAVAEMAIGTATMTAVFALAQSGMISGGGDPDPRKKSTAMAAGWQPYSIKLGNTWYSIQRLQPIGTLIGLAADMSDAWAHMTPEESDKVPKILATAFSNAVTNQTFLQGLVQIVNVISDPERYGGRFFENLAGSVIPGIVGQTAQMMDPYQREIDSIKDAVVSRIPGARESLMPKRDAYGEMVPAKGRALGIPTMDESDDKVRTEAKRLMVGTSKAPKALELPAGRDAKLGKVPLTMEERDLFADKSGKLAYQILDRMVNSPTWDNMPDMIQKNAMNMVFEKSKAAGKAAVLTPERIQVEADRIHNELVKRLAPK